MAKGSGVTMGGEQFDAPADCLYFANATPNSCTCGWMSRIIGFACGQPWNVCALCQKFGPPDEGNRELAKRVLQAFESCLLVHGLPGFFCDTAITVQELADRYVLLVPVERFREAIARAAKAQAVASLTHPEADAAAIGAAWDEIGVKHGCTDLIDAVADSMRRMVESEPVGNPN